MVRRAIPAHFGALRRNSLTLPPSPLRYDELCTAEEEAAKGKKGLHSSAPPPARVAPTDLSLPNAKERAKSYVGSFQRQGRLRAVVQFIFNGARFKLLVLKVRRPRRSHVPRHSHI